MLYLFDIDGTLIDTGGAGMAALTQTATDLYGSEGPPLDLAGSTDSGIVMGLFDYFEEIHEPGKFLTFYDHYLLRLAENLNSPTFSEGRVLPGALPLLEKLQAQGHTLGLLTGNIAEGARIKITHFNLASFFSFGSYGDDHHDRNQLGPIALERAALVTRQNFTPSQTIVIGDTPKDIACARAFGATTIAVATGRFTSAELASHKPDQILETLEEPILSSLDSSQP